MNILNPGYETTLNLAANQTLYVETLGLVVVTAVSGLGITAGVLASVDGSQTFGPYAADGVLTIAATKSDCTYGVSDADNVARVITNPLTGGLALVGPDGNLTPVAGAGFHVVPPTRDSAGIEIAVSACAVFGGGTVIFEDADYDITADHTFVNNVKYIGVPAKLSFVGNLPDAQFTATGGTRFISPAGINHLKFNNVDQGVIATDLAPTACTGVYVRGITFIGGRSHIDTGAALAMGMVYSRFEELYSFDSTDFGFNFENFQHCTFRNLYQSTVLAAGGGGIRFANSLDDTLLPGNSTIDGEIYTYCTSRMARSVVFECTGPAGCQMNELLVAGRIQGNRYGAPSTLAISGSFTNGSANIVVADNTQYENCKIGMPVVFAGTTPGGFTQNVEYWVASRNDGTETITLAANPLSSSGVSSTSTGAFTMTCGGFPSLEIHANSTSTFTNCDFGFWDLENYFGITSVSIRRTRTCVAELSENFASQAKNALVFRDAGIAIEAGNVSNITTDVDSASNIAINYALGGVRSLSAGETLVNARANCELQLTNAAAQNVTVNAGLFWGFKTSLVQMGAGQVTFVAGSGVTINSRNGLKTAGQYARVTLTQVAKDVYILSGDTAV